LKQTCSRRCAADDSNDKRHRPQSTPPRPRRHCSPKKVSKS
jgi:hypothetical protein